MVVASSIAAYSPRRGPELVDESYPTGGIPRCAYSRDKAVLEGLVRDVTERAHGRMRVAAIRPSLVGQRAAGSQMLRMGLPVLTPARLLRHLPVLGVDRSLGVQAVHADDVADAVVRILEQEREGPFNVVGDGVLDALELADIFGARHVHVPWRVTRAVAAAAWHARLQPLDPGWIEMAHRVPWVSAARARDELGWEPAHTARDVLAELVRGMSDRASGPTRPLRERDLGEELTKTVQEGPASHRSHT
jgi:nucleoside-diphosphate-sugar epimerase